MGKGRYRDAIEEVGEEAQETARPERRGNCTCGIEIEKARRLCTERDCPYK